MQTSAGLDACPPTSTPQLRASYNSKTNDFYMSFSYSESFSLGDRVQITRDGAKEHRKYIQSCALGAGVAAGAVALPAALPGSIAAGIGIVSGGAGIGVSAGAVAGVGGAAGAGVGKVVENFLHFPEAGDIGTVVEKKNRGFGRPGYDYRVQWDAEEGETIKSTWHRSRHLDRID
jgi:hypothetical protein